MSILDSLIVGKGSLNPLELPRQLQLMIDLLQQIKLNLDDLIAAQSAPPAEQEQLTVGPFGGSTAANAPNGTPMPLAARVKSVVVSSDTQGLFGLRVDAQVVLPFYVGAFATESIQLGDKGLLIARGARVSIDQANAPNAAVTAVMFVVPQG